MGLIQNMSLSIRLPDEHPKIEFGKIGILLVNLGSPESLGYLSMRRYLKQLLSDKRVIEENSILWKIVLYGIVLTKRPFAIDRLYKEIWNKEKNEAPLLTTTRKTTEGFADKIKKISQNNDIIVTWAMRYGKPSIKAEIQKMKKQGCEKLLIMPLYPQYCASTTASVMDECFDALKKIRWMPSIRTLPPYYDNPLYINALAKTISEQEKNLDFRPDKFIISFHGIPQEYFQKGDPYHCHCQKTARMLIEKIGWQKDKVKVSFQSRFGKKPWLQPYTDVVVSELAKQDCDNIIIVAPGFSADCLETTEEINKEVRELFFNNGGKKFDYIKCLNDTEIATDLYVSLAQNELLGWL